MEQKDYFDNEDIALLGLDLVIVGLWLGKHIDIAVYQASILGAVEVWSQEVEERIQCKDSSA